jgi:ribosomal 50S subunit-recycling heat shock protein
VKRRTIARELCEAGRVLVNGHPSKPAKEIRPRDTVTLQFNTRSIELEVLDVPFSSKKISPELLYRITAERRIESENSA